MSILQQIVELLDGHDAPFELTSHRPVYTSAEAADIRGESLHSGAKAMVVKAQDRFVLLVLPGDFLVESKPAKKLVGAKSICFASRAEVSELTGLESGAIPPFGSLFGLDTYCDAGLADNEQINFNAGTHTESIRLGYEDYLRAEQPTVGQFGQPAEQSQSP
jgi:Ala-tRNA(Pro) deacylase